MSNLQNFRQINDFEKQIIIDSLLKISSEFLRVIEEFKIHLYILTNSSLSKDKFPKIFLITKYQHFRLKLTHFDKIFSAGLYFGFIKKGNFYLSLEGADYLYKQGIFSNNKCIHVNRKGENSILYGNNLLKNMVIKTSNNLQKKDFLLVFNEMNELLAIAQFIVESNVLQYLKPKDIIALNLSDKGIYLREKQ